MLRFWHRCFETSRMAHMLALFFLNFRTVSLTFPGLRANMQLANQPEHLENEISAPPSVQVDVNIHHYAPTPKDAEIDKMSASFLLPKVPVLKDFRQFGASLRESRMAGLCFIRCNYSVDHGAQGRGRTSPPPAGAPPLIGEAI